MGRPKRTLLDEAATRVWFSAVSLGSGLPTAYQLERHFASLDSATHDTSGGRSCKWDKYRRGSNTPSKKTRDRVETEFPGTRRWLEHPIWEICSDSHLTNDQLSAAIGLVRPKLARYVGQPTSSTERCYLAYPQSIFSLRYQADLPSLVALLAICRDGEAKKDAGQCVDAIYASALTASLLLTRQPFKAALRPLMEHLCSKYFAVTLYDTLPPFINAEEATYFVCQLGLLIDDGEKSGLISKKKGDAVVLAQWAYENKDWLNLTGRLALEKKDNKEWPKTFYGARGTSKGSYYLSERLKLAKLRTTYGSNVSAELVLECEKEVLLSPKRACLLKGST